VARDVDGDGDLDLVLGNWGLQDRLYRNDGTGTFADATQALMPVDGSFTNAVAAGDVDGDGDLDLVVGNGDQSEPSRLYLNAGPGRFFDAAAPRLPVTRGRTFAMALGDVDGDGDLDLVCGSSSGIFLAGQNRLYLNDGRGTFVDATAVQMPAAIDQTLAVALGDVDGDGDLDLVLGNGGTPGLQDGLYLNDGTGTFADVTAGRMPVDNEDTRAVALGDVDGDGDLDLLRGNAGNPGWQNRLYLNNGAGAFTDATPARMPTDWDDTRAMVLGDVDGDGDLDLVVANMGTRGQQNKLYLNNGAGAFIDSTAARMPVEEDPTAAVALGDVDGEGDLDLVVGNWGQSRLCLNDGTGTFTDVTAVRLPLVRVRTNAVALGDVDDDGDLDLVSGNGGAAADQSRLYSNDGTGTFTDVTAARMPVRLDITTSVAFGDVDGDDDLDLLTGNSGSDGKQNRLCLNLRRQLDAPLLLRIGRPYQLDAYARWGPASQVDLAFPVLSSAAASILLPPFGTLGIDPARILGVLPAIVVPHPAGVGSLSFVVPGNPSLVGLAAHAQALLLHHPVQARLTNVTVDVVMR
jgi:hypothetical protein